MKNRIKFIYALVSIWIAPILFGVDVYSFGQDAQYEARFASPRVIQNEGADFALLETIIDLIDATPKGEEIIVCIFKFSYNKILKALERAEERGVDVKIILNKGSTSKEVNKDTKDELENAFKSFYYVENNISKKAIIHNKFILFSETFVSGKTWQDVVLQTSGNFQKKSAEKLQDMVIFSDSEIYDGYRKYWARIKSLHKDGSLKDYNYFNKKNSLKTIEAFFYPKIADRKKHGKDDIRKILKEIEHPEKATIKFAHGKWDDERLDIVDELLDLRDEGTKVAVVSNTDIDDDARKQLKKIGENAVFLDKSINLHTKFLLIEDGGDKLVVTGSHNITERSLRKNFEVLLVINNEQLFNDYSRFFNEILRFAR